MTDNATQSDAMTNPGLSPDAAADALFSGNAGEEGSDLFFENNRVDEAPQADVQTRGGKRIQNEDDADADEDAADEAVQAEDGDANEGDADAAAEGEEGDEAEGAEDASVVELTIDGEAREVPLDDLADAYIARQRGELEYDAKVQELNLQAQQVVNEHVQQVTGVRQQLVMQLQQMQQAQAANRPQPPDISLLDSSNPNYDPDGYTRQRALYEQAADAERQVQYQIEAQQAQMQAENEAQMNQLRTSQYNELVTQWPEWSDSKTRNEFLSNVQSEFGFNENEVGNIYDHRFYLLARDAIAHRKAARSGEKVAKPRVRAAQAPRLRKGAPDGKRQANKMDRQKAVQQVRKAQRLEDIAETFQNFID